jgi:hypothetical protein
VKSNRLAFVNRYRSAVLHGSDKAPGRKWNQPDPTVPYAGRKRKNRKQKEQES